MRILAVLAVVVVASLAWLALRPEESAGHDSPPTTRTQWERDSKQGVDRPAAKPKPPSTVPELLDALRDGQVTDADRSAVEEFRKGWVVRGANAVPEIEALLRGDSDVPLLASWAPGQESEAAPTLRAACILALAAIPGAEATAALRRLLPAARSPGEAFLAARELMVREETGWGAAALDHATTEAESGQDHYQGELVKLAARSDPVETTLRLLRAAPRDREQRDPGSLARALTHLPWSDALRVVPGLLEETTVTPRAKRRYAQALLARAEPETVALLRDTWERAGQSDALREAFADALVRSDAWKASDARSEECCRLLREFYPSTEAAPGSVRRVFRELEGK